MKVSVIGTGYVGLITGVCLAEMGHRIVCVDRDLDKVETINRAEAPIYEEGLEGLLARNVGKRLYATTDLRRAVADTELTLIAVGTPFNGKGIDLGYIRDAAIEVGRALSDKPDYHVVVVKSTVVPGTTDEVVVPILESASGKKVGREFGVGMNPEFLREGSAVSDFLHPDRIVIGANDGKSLEIMGELYRCFNGADLIRTNNKTAEMIKYASNALFATMISFSNEIGNLCSSLGDVDVVDVMRGVHLDRRIAPVAQGGRRIVPGVTAYLEAGCGFGGSCFPKDLKALVAHGERAGTRMHLLKSVLTVNRDQPLKMLELLKRHFACLNGLKVSVLGLAFKPGTDDMRGSPAVPIISALLRGGASVKAYDPVARYEAEKVLGDSGITYCDTLEEAVKGVNAVLLVTSWEEFRRLNGMLNDVDDPPLVVDGRRLLDKTRIPRYEGIGL